MKKEDLEEMFDERFSDISRSIEKNYDEDLWDVKDYFFETIIPEVLKSVIPTLERYAVEWDYLWWINDAIKYSKQKAKELYNITL